MNPLALEIDEFQMDTCRVAGELRICTNGCRSIERRSISQYSSVYGNRFSSSDRLLSSSFCIFANRSLFGFDRMGRMVPGQRLMLIKAILKRTNKPEVGPCGGERRKKGTKQRTRESRRDRTGQNGTERECGRTAVRGELVVG